MSAYPSFTLDDLSKFSGRPAESYTLTDYVNTALGQAELLFKVATCLFALPDDDFSQELAKNALLSMADSLYLGQQYQLAEASPFNSESIGSYSYSKTYSRAGAAVQQKVGTGVMWFDTAVDQLGMCDSTDGIPVHGGITMSMGDHMYFPDGSGSGFFLSPADIRRSTEWGFDPSVVGWL